MKKSIIPGLSKFGDNKTETLSIEGTKISPIKSTVSQLFFTKHLFLNLDKNRNNI